MNEDRRREKNRSVSKAMKRSAKVRTCPECKRGNALVRDQPPLTPGWVGKHCRYCDYSRGTWL